MNARELDIKMLDNWARSTDAERGGTVAAQIVGAARRDYPPTSLEGRAACAKYIMEKAEKWDLDAPDLSQWLDPERAALRAEVPEHVERMSPETVEIAMEEVRGPLDIDRYFHHDSGGPQGKRMGQYVATPRMLNYIDLPPHGREVYRALCAMADNITHLAQVGYNRLAIESGMDRTAAVRWVKKLEECGLIQIVRRSQDRVHPNIYRVLYPKDWPPRYRHQLVTALERIRAGSLGSGRVVAQPQQGNGAELPG